MSAYDGTQPPAMAAPYATHGVPTWDHQIFDLLNLENSLDGDDLNHSSASASGQTTPYETIELPAPLDLSSIAQDVVSRPASTGSNTKKGGRLDKQAVSIMRRWLEINKHHPYPTNDDISVIQYQTGLSTTQIAHWFSNARRRTKIQRARSSYQSVEDKTDNAHETPPRPGTPAPRRNTRAMTPIERWYDSPPENEPAAVTAIARAVGDGVALTPGQVPEWNGVYLRYGASPASSFGTSESSDVSAASGNSARSDPVEPSLRPRSVRRKRNHKQRHVPRTSLSNSLLPYQCTFCTETFKTKHDWQRHEKSLHLALEQWICSFSGPCAVKEEASCCAFCAQPEPDELHLATHNFRTCQERGLEERTFLRKDHLNQHLRLVHGVKYAPWSMDAWKVAIPDIKSRCGFCGIALSTWPERADHLAGHYKTGSTMRDWHGDWGFDPEVSKMVENAIPPYYIDWERHTAAPYRAGEAPVNSPANAYDLIRVEIEHWVQNQFDITGKMPSNEEMQLEACRVIFASEAASTAQTGYTASWLRDLIMSSNELAIQAQFGPLRMRNEGRLSQLQINGKDNLFELCPLESQLCAFVQFEQVMEHPIRNDMIQEQACKIVTGMGQPTTTFADTFKNFIITLIYTNPKWLSDFKQRTGIVCAEDVNALLSASGDINLSTLTPNIQSDQSNVVSTPFMQPRQQYLMSHSAMNTPPVQASYGLTSTGQPQVHSLVNNANFHDWLLRDLTRWVKATMAPNNPNRHIPSDEEIQHQARWVMYNDDDPWNQTAADTTEWLRQFKIDVGIITEADMAHIASH